VKHTPNAGRGIVVVDRRPLERSLVRFILHENGFDVVAEAATPAEAVRAVESHEPAVVVLHENAAWERGQRTIPLIRDVLPGAKVLVIAPAFGVVRVELLRDADAVLEEGVGFKDLPFVVGRLASGEVPRTPTGAAGTPPAPVTATERGRERERWANRLQGATAAAVVFLALIVARAALPPGPEAIGSRPVVALENAMSSLSELRAASDAAPQDLLEQAVQLAVDRARAIEAGANVTDLDAQIVQIVDAMLPSLPDNYARALVAVFAGVSGLPDAPPSSPSPSPTEIPASETPKPKPSPGDEPSPTPSPSIVVPVPAPTDTPSPTETPSPTPTETPSPSPSPSPSDTPSPSPSESPSPSPSPSESPSPSPTDSPSPSPTETPSPSPTEPSGSPSPSPTESPSPPSPSVTETPTVTDSPPPTATITRVPTSPTDGTSETAGSSSTPDASAAAAILVVPPGIGLLATGWARRRARRSGR
jgi:hypothetical protein